MLYPQYVCGVLKNCVPQSKISISNKSEAKPRQYVRRTGGVRFFLARRAFKNIQQGDNFKP